MLVLDVSRKHKVRLSSDDFRQWTNKSITLLGMSGVGKSFISNILRNNEWFHYSGDYRIGTRYMNEPILDNVKAQAMQVPFLQDLLRSDSIFISSNITFEHLKPLSIFLGKLGDPAKGGLTIKEFKYRLQLHHKAEVAAMLDVPEFMHKSRAIYGFNHFINDAGGSLCELDDQQVLDTLSENTLMLYIEATEKDEQTLIERAVSAPKPLYYREAFLDEQLVVFMEERSLEYVALVDPDDFVRWVFPKLFRTRVPRYQAIAKEYGYTIAARDAFAVSNADEFLQLIGSALES